MPLYEYECKKCHHRFERIQKYSDPHLKKCPDCGAPVELVLSAPAVQFKGSGWYVTDYARKSAASSTSSDSESGSKADAESKGGDSKEPDAKSKKPEKSKQDSGKKTEKKTHSSEKS